MIDGDITAQTEQVMRNLAALLKAAGVGFEHVARTTVFLADMNDFAAMNAVYGKYVVDPPPARATVQVARLPKDARVEIDLIAVIA
jgi:2-iminobutanoate/2-iminopropanoate deaminase